MTTEERPLKTPQMPSVGTSLSRPTYSTMMRLCRLMKAPTPAAHTPITTDAQVRPCTKVKAGENRLINACVHFLFFLIIAINQY